MASRASVSISGLLLSLIVSTFCFAAASAQLSPFYYLFTCPLAQTIIHTKVTAAVLQEPRLAASLLRLHFHDCFVNGCDASILLDDTPSFTGEKTALPNLNSVRGFEVIDKIKSELELLCPGVVSCADILTVAARDSVFALGGPWWSVPLGRRDSTTANFTGANTDLPSPFSDVPQLISAFAKKGLSTTDMVALSGAHTIGKARCLVFRNRIYNESNIDSSFAASRQANCPITGGNDNLAPLDTVSENVFDNFYFINLLNQKGLLHSDQVLFNNGPTDSLVQLYATNIVAFFSDFKTAMIKMGNIQLLTGSSGIVRNNCRFVN